MDHDGIVGFVNLFVPNLLKDFVRGEDLAGVGGKEVEDVELDRGQLDVFAVDGVK